MLINISFLHHIFANGRKNGGKEKSKEKKNKKKRSDTASSIKVCKFRFKKSTRCTSRVNLCFSDLGTNSIYLEIKDLRIHKD